MDILIITVYLCNKPKVNDMHLRKIQGKDYLQMFDKKTKRKFNLLLK